ncbi:MAG: cupin-like domain-containing protein [Flavobacteriales bacterium AspAUS03]
MAHQFQPIKRVERISKEDFLKNYYKPQKPLIIEKLTEDWPAYKKWDLSYIKNIAGDNVVPLYDDSPIDYSRNVNEPIARMKMREYLDLLEKEPTNLRIFLYNLMNRVPQLKEDFKFPHLGIRLIKEFPMLFFGGANSRVFMHYDIDLANILHFHFHGKKQCILFPISDRKYMYKVPYSVICHESIDFENIDFEKWPALKKTHGYIAELDHGEALYMPEGWWHHMKYLTTGFSMSLRALPGKISHIGEAVYNIFVVRHIDNFMRKWKRENWLVYKNQRAITNTHKRFRINTKR